MSDLANILAHYDIHGEVIGRIAGPLVTQIKFRPTAGTKLKSITAITEDIRREMGVSALRISNVCDDNCIGFEIPNEKIETIDLRQIFSSEDFHQATGALPLSLGVRIDGKPVFADLAKMPHLLVAGATGSGKSVGLNAFILSLIARYQPTDLQFVLIDPKRIEFSVYHDMSYLYMPVITDNQQASTALAHLVDEMNQRYDLLSRSKAKNIEEYHQDGHKLPYIIVIIDEFSDLVLTDKSVEKSIQILAQKARAAGIHLILATQRPSVDVVTGSIKANFPTRMAFKTASGIDSKTILDTTGAEDLAGRGDALFLAANGTLTRVHGAYISTPEIENMLKPYAGKTKFIEIPSSKKSVAPAKNKTTKEPFFLWVWLVALWKFLGKREQKKLIKAALNLFLNKKIK